MPHEYLLPLLVSNGAAAALVFLAWKRPRAARVLLGIGFLAASSYNVITALRAPQVYVSGFGPTAVRLYQDIIYGPFAAHAAAWVLAIAAGQCAAGALLLTRRYRRLGAAAAMIFLVAIAPLGIGSAFPSTLIIAAAAALAARTPKSAKTTAAAGRLE